MWQAGGTEEGDQVFEFFARQVAELLSVADTEWFVQLVHQSDTGRGDADMDDAPVLGGPIARDEATLLQFVEQAGDVRGAGDEAGGEIESAQRAGMFAAQQAQRVVLLRRQIVAAEQVILQGAKAVVGAPQAEERLLFQGIEAAPRPNLTRWNRAHVSKLKVPTIVVQTILKRGQITPCNPGVYVEISSR